MARHGFSWRQSLAKLLAGQLGEVQLGSSEEPDPLLSRDAGNNIYLSVETGIGDALGSRWRRQIEPQQCMALASSDDALMVELSARHARPALSTATPPT